MSKFNRLEDIDVSGKTVLVRVDYNVPFNGAGEIEDDTRIRASLPTINYLLGQGAKIVLCSHLGRPKGKVDEALRMDGVAERLDDLIDVEVRKLNDCVGAEVRAVVDGMGAGQIVLLENLRFHAEEEANDEDFAKSLADLADVYVMDAFGTMHREHASTYGVVGLLEAAAAGKLVEKEIDVLTDVLKNPEQPFTSVIGGAKISDKIGVVRNLLERGKVLIGGGMVFTFYRAKGYEIGSSLVEDDYVDLARDLIDHENLVLPKDIVVCRNVDGKGRIKTVRYDGIEKGWIGLDIGKETVGDYCGIIEGSKTVIWAGPLGRYEVVNFAEGTDKIAAAMSRVDGVSIVGGGDSVAAVENAGYVDKLTHVSTGGSAFLEFIEGKKLPGILALEKSYKA